MILFRSHFVIPAPSVNYSEKRQNETFERRSIFLDFFWTILLLKPAESAILYNASLTSYLASPETSCLLSLIF